MRRGAKIALAAPCTARAAAFAAAALTPTALAAAALAAAAFSAAALAAASIATSTLDAALTAPALASSTLTTTLPAPSIPTAALTATVSSAAISSSTVSAAPLTPSTLAAAVASPSVASIPTDAASITSPILCRRGRRTERKLQQQLSRAGHLVGCRCRPHRAPGARRRRGAAGLGRRFPGVVACEGQGARALRRERRGAYLRGGRLQHVPGQPRAALLGDCALPLGRSRGWEHHLRALAL